MRSLKNANGKLLLFNSLHNLDNKSYKLTFKEEWNNGISAEELKTNLLKKVHTRWNEKLALAKIESFKER
jgi:hypothetical protein